MNKCLVTKLNEAVDNNELLRIGELRFSIKEINNPTSSTQSFSLSVDNPVTLEIIGDGYFTDSSLSKNNGKTIKSYNGETVYVSNSNVQVAVLGKYNITNILKTNEWTNKFIDIEMLTYCLNLGTLKFPINAKTTGDISCLAKLTELQFLHLYNTNIYGDISSLKDLVSLEELYFQNTKVTGDVSNLSKLVNLKKFASGKLSGDISNFSNLTNLVILSIIGCSGDISNFKKLINLNQVSIINTSVSGDISVFKNMQNLKTIILNNGNISGDMATLPDSCIYFCCYQDNNSITWTTRPSSANILAINTSITLSNIDDMLKNQAECKVGYSESSVPEYKCIKIKGTRTSASDTAVQALQNKGYTISIIKA